MYKAPGSSTQLPVAEVRHSVDRSDGVTNSRDRTRVAATGSLAIAGQFTVVHSFLWRVPEFHNRRADAALL